MGLEGMSSRGSAEEGRRGLAPPQMAAQQAGDAGEAAIGPSGSGEGELGNRSPTVFTILGLVQVGVL